MSPNRRATLAIAIGVFVLLAAATGGGAGAFLWADRHEQAALGTLEPEIRRLAVLSEFMRAQARGRIILIRSAPGLSPRINQGLSPRINQGLSPRINQGLSPKKKGATDAGD